MIEMRELGILFRLELRALFELRHTRDPKERRRGRLLLGTGVFLAVLLVSYIVGLVVGFAALGLSDIVPLYLAMISSLVVLLFGIFKAGNTLFSKGGYDLLLSMPLRPRSIIWARFGVMYLQDVLFTAAILLPGGVTYGILCRPSVGFYPMGVVGCLLLPAIPLVLSTLLGTLITAISVRMKHKSLWQALLAVLVVVGVMALSFSLSNGNLSGESTEDFLKNALQSATALLSTLYPPAVWFTDALLGGSVMGLVWFTLLSLGALVLCLAVATCLFSRIMRGLYAVNAGHDFQLGALERRNLLHALYVREIKRYFASSVYVSNTILGPILATVFCVVLCVMGVEAFESAVPDALPVRTLLPLLFSGILCMMPTTSVAISMEGGQMDTIKSLPIPAQVWLSSKLLVGLTFMLPAWLISEILLTFALRPTLPDFAAQVLTPLAMAIFSAVLGITVNLKFHSFDWEREEVPVKQSLSTLLEGFAGLLLPLVLCGIICLLPPARGSYVSLTAALILLALSALLCRRNGRVRPEEL